MRYLHFLHIVRQAKFSQFPEIVNPLNCRITYSMFRINAGMI